MRQLLFCVLLQSVLFNKYSFEVKACVSDQKRIRPFRISTNICRYRGTPYPEKVFLIYASWGCYRYTRNDLFLGGEIPVQACTIQVDSEDETIYTVPGILMNETCIPFSHINEDIRNCVLDSFQNENIVQRWIDCSEDALTCCQTVLNQYQGEETNCPPTWDAWTCFETAPADSTIKKRCSPYSYIAQAPRCHHYSYKECFSNGTWNSQTDYSTCSITPRLITRTNWHISMLSVSIIIGTPAIILLICYQGHQRQKFTLIRNLIVSIVLRDILVLITKQAIIKEEMTSPNETIMSRNEWTCKFLAVSEKLAKNFVFACMLLEGIFLHQLLTNVFASRGQSIPAMMIYYVVIFGVSVIAALSWLIAMAVAADEFCWQVTESNYFHWINDAPKLVMLITCTILLCHIIFNIWTAFKNQDNIQHPAIRTAKASFLCMPLFGIPFLFFLGRPDTDSCPAEQVYYFLSYAFDGLQGAFVAILHCYIDKEIIKYYSRKFEYFAARFSSIKRPVSPGLSHDRKTSIITHRSDTTCTVVDDNGITSRLKEQNESANLPSPLGRS